MKYNSLNFNATPASFKEAVIRGLAPDRGLYFPEKIPTLPKSFLTKIERLSRTEIALRVIEPFVGKTIPKKKLEQIVSETIQFDFPLVRLSQNIGILELFHGPTLAFKDVGARFMARCLSHFNTENQHQKTVVLVATSGDTGGAVADGFLGVPGIEVVILYPKGKVSHIQEKQLTTHGQNIKALEVDGVFDDCQDMVKTAFLDMQLQKKIKLTSANSINVARWLPQMFYYFFGYQTWKSEERDKDKKLVFSVPSGNFGNLCAGMLAYKMGLPINHFVASTNANDTIPKFLKTGHYAPQKTIQTLSNAMDVSDPSNWTRLQRLFNQDFYKLKKKLSSYSFSDSETRKGLKRIFENYNYVADPHGVLGYLGLLEFMAKNKGYYGIFLETAHPVKFANTVEKTLNTKVAIPDQLKKTLQKEQSSVPISNYHELKSFLLND